MPISALGVCSWSLQPDSPEDLVKRLELTGLDHTQIAMSPAVSDRDRWGNVIPILSEAGISIASGMMAPVGEDYSSLESIARTGGIRPSAIWPANEAMARAMAVLAGTSGIELVTLHAGFLPHDREDQERASMVSRLRLLGSIFSAQGCRLGFETGQESAATLLEVLDEIDHASVGVNFDPANMILYGMGDPVEAVEVLREHIFQIHIKDATASDVSGEWGTEMVVGEGQVDWPRFLSVVQSLDQDVEAIIERESGSSRVEDIRTAVDLLREHVDVETP
tara:strand:+ start:25285 stop:26121 length:837 start_codon:yes stop_codon:yes gene_type:complete